MRKIPAILFAAIFIFTSFPQFAQENQAYKLDVTFFVASDLHFDPPPETDQYYHVVAMNTICGSVEGKDALIWPNEIDGAVTDFGSAGQRIQLPKGVVTCGDITDRADPRALHAASGSAFVG